MYGDELASYLETKENILSILEGIYGKVEERQAERKEAGVHACVGYYQIGEKAPFVLTDDAVNKLCDCVKEYLKIMIPKLKCNKTEDELLEDYLNETDDIV